jgi:DNA-directed RNA polymerase subunit RPC12/RpoP
MSTQGTSEKKYDRDWRVIVSDLASALQAGGYGPKLHQAIKKRRLDGKVLWIALVCSGCGSFVASADNLTVDHLEETPKQPSIPCPRCGSDAGHVYRGLRTS